MAEMYLWGGVLRFAQVVLQAAPTILVGLLVVGVFQRLLGAERTRQLFGGSTWRALPQAWLVGMLLPVCSLGAIPIMREMRRVGISGGTVVAFGLTAPLFNPISVLYGLTLSDPVVILTFAFCSLLIVTVCGTVWMPLLRAREEEGGELPEVPHGVKRIAAVALAAVRELMGPASLYMLIGVLGVAGISMLLPFGSLQAAASHDDPTAPLFMSGVALPVYATPMVAMVQLASMFHHGNSVGAAFALLVLGAGTNLGVIALIWRSYGFLRSLTWFVFFVGSVVLLAYALDEPLYPTGVEPAGHTHAFDNYCCPFNGPTDYASFIRRKLWRGTTPYEWLASGLLLVMGLGAGVMRWFTPREALDQWLEKEPASPPRFDRPLSAPVLGSAALIGVIALSVVGCYLYYPPAEEILAEIRLANTELASAAITSDWDTAEYWGPICDDWSRKLEVSIVIRGGQVTESRRQSGYRFREMLDQLHHAVEERSGEEAQRLALDIQAAYRAMRDAYSPDRDTPTSTALPAAG